MQNSNIHHKIDFESFIFEILGGWDMEMISFANQSVS